MKLEKLPNAAVAGNLWNIADEFASLVYFTLNLKSLIPRYIFLRIYESHKSEILGAVKGDIISSPYTFTWWRE